MKAWHGPLAACAALAVLWTAPPVFGIDTESGGRLHQAIGHRARWSPPGPDEVCVVLRERQLASGAGAALGCPPSAARRGSLQARVNTVHLLIESTAVLLAGVAWLLLARRRSSIDRRLCQPPPSGAGTP